VTTPNIVVPQLIVEAGLVTTNPVQPGTVLILDDITFGLLDTGTLAADDTWTDLSSGFPQRVLGFTISRPSTRLQGPLWNYQAATASILCDNSDGALDPDNLAGPYVTGGATQLLPMVPVRVRGVFAGAAYPLYSGFADGWVPAQVTYLGGYAAVTIPCTDGFKILAGTTLAASSAVGTGDTSGARVNRILTLAGWYTTRRVISAGNSTVQGTTLGADALSLMQIATDSEIGQLYQDSAGAVRFRARRDLLTTTRSDTIQAIFGDLPGTVHPAGTRPTSTANNFEGGTAGSTITAAGSGGASGAAFDIIITSGGGTVTWSNTQAAHGALSGSCVTTGSASAAQFGYSSAVLGTADPQLWTRFYLYLSALPAAADSLMRFGNGAGSTLLTKISLGTTGKITVGATTSSWSLPAAQWVRVEANLTFPGDSTAAFTLHAYLTPDGATADYTLTSTGETFGAVAGCNDVRWGMTNSAASNFTAFFDDVDVNSTGYDGPATGTAFTELPYAAVGRMIDDTTVANDVQATRLGGTLQEVKDTASIAKLRFPRSYARSDLILQTDTDALGWAQWVLGISKTAEDRFESLTIDPQADPYSLWPQCLGREIGDRIQVWHRPASVAGFAKDCFISGISHAWDSVSQAWQTTWTLQDATRYSSYLVLDAPVLGQLDLNMLAW